MLVKELLKHKYVKRLFLGRFISNYGNGMGPIALSFGILELPNGSANLLGLVLGSTTVCFLLMAPFGGVIADKELIELKNMARDIQRVIKDIEGKSSKW